MVEKKGYAMEQMYFPELPFYLTVYRTIKDNSVSVEVHSTIHVNKIVKLPTSWSVGFVQSYPRQFVGDVLDLIVKYYGLKPSPITYC